MVRSTCKSDISEGASASADTAPKETVDFKVVYNKQKYDVTFPVDDSVSSLKAHLEKLTGEFCNLPTTYR